MSSDKHCCVPGCKESGGMHAVLHGFPNPEKDRKRFNTWLYKIGGDILGLENERIKYRCVCRSHFEEKYLCRNNRISNIAVPTLNMPDPLKRFELVNRQPMQEIQNLIEPSTSTETGTDEQVPPSNQVIVQQTLETRMDEQATPSNQVIEKSVPQTPATQMDEQVPPSNQVIEKSVHQTIESRMDEQVPPSNQVIEKSVQQTLGDKTAVSRNVRRLFLTNTEKELHKKIVAAKLKICKMKSKVKKQKAEAKAIKIFASNPSVLDVLDNCSSTAKLLMQIQWRENKKKEKGRRFTLQEKIVALSLLKQSPRGYRFFRKIFILPAPQTLIKLVQKCNLRPGINKNIFSQLKQKAETMKVEEKLCILMFDEVSLKANVTYHEKKDKITGFVDDGEQRKPEFADHAQVFMVRGIFQNYKQPISYTFSSSATKGPELAKQIKQVITKLQQAGLIVVASVCDQGANNRQAIKLCLNETRGIYLRRGETPKENIILINNQEIVPLFDPPHLLKCLRNNLLTKNLIFEKDGVTKTAKWAHLEQLYGENPGYKGIRLIPKLTENHIKPEKLNKMKVKYASQIFSRTVSSNMGYLADKGILPSECKHTADLLLFIDDIFDSVNGSYKKNKYAKPLLGPATPKSMHHKTWAEGKKVFKSIKFITSEGKVESIPTLSNWVWTLEGLEVLLKNLEVDFGITSVWLRHLNQDPLENFFGSIRSHGCRNINPTCDQFESAFVTLLINNLNSVHTRGRNCEGDFCHALHTLVINDNPEPTTSTCTIDLEKLLDLNFTPLEEKEKDHRIIQPLQYVSGYFVKKAKARIFKKCSQCKINLLSNNENEYIHYREYAGRRWLCTPSHELVKLISNMQDVIKF